MRGGKRQNSGRKPTGTKPYKVICVNEEVQKKLKEIEPEGKTLLQKLKNLLKKY